VRVRARARARARAGFDGAGRRGGPPKPAAQCTGGEGHWIGRGGPCAAARAPRPPARRGAGSPWCTGRRARCAARPRRTGRRGERGRGRGSVGLMYTRVGRTGRGGEGGSFRLALAALGGKRGPRGGDRRQKASSNSQLRSERPPPNPSCAPLQRERRASESPFRALSARRSQGRRRERTWQKAR
jgi:hypothetical protein